MGLFALGNSHWNISDGARADWDQYLIGGVQLTQLVLAAMQEIDTELAANGEGKSNELYETALIRHKAVGAPQETARYLEHLMHNRENHFDARNPMSSIFFSYASEWNFGLQVRRLQLGWPISVTDHNRIQFDAWSYGEGTQVSYYSPRSQGIFGNMNQAKDPMGTIELHGKRLEKLFLNSTQNKSAVARAATRYIAGSLLHEFMHGEGFDHPDSTGDPDYARSINDICDYAMVQVLFKRPFSLVEGLPSSEEEQILKELPLSPK